MPCVPRLLLLAQSKFAALHTDMESHFKEEEDVSAGSGEGAALHVL